MNKRTYTILSVAAIAVMAGALFGCTFTSALNGGSTFSVSKTDADVMQKITEMGGLNFMLPLAFAEMGACDSEA